MRISQGTEQIRLWLNDYYAIVQRRDSKFYVLEYYRYGIDHMPDELYYGHSLFETYEKYKEVCIY